MVWKPAWMRDVWRRPFPPVSLKYSKMTAAHNAECGCYKGKPLYVNLVPESVVLLDPLRLGVRRTTLFKNICLFRLLLVPSNNASPSSQTD